MTPTEAARQVAVIRAAIAIKRDAAQTPDDTIVLDAVRGAINLLAGLCVNVAMIRHHMEAKMDDGK